MDCESPTTLEASYRAIAERFQLPGTDDHRADIIERTKDYLNRDETGNRLMILQNTSPSTIGWQFSSGLTTICPNRFPLNLACCLPDISRCQILCISGDSRIAEQLPGNPTILEIPTLHNEEATSLLHSKIPKELSTGAPALAIVLGCRPLAVCQAAAYMIATRCDVPQYLSLLKTTFPLNYQRILREPATDQNLSEPCHKTTQISFASVQKQNTRASDLLSLMVVCHRKNISKSLLWYAWKMGLSGLMTLSSLSDFQIPAESILRDSMSDSDQSEYVEFSIALATLETYLLIQYDASNETYSMQRIVQSAILPVLQCQDTISTWRSSAIVLLSSTTHVFRLPIKPGPHIISTLIIHLSEIAQHPHTTVCAGLAKAKALGDVAAFKISLMHPRASTLLLQDTYKIQSGLLKPQDGRLLRTLLSLAESTSYSDSPAAAIPLLVLAIAGYKQTLGPGNRRTLFAQINLCSNYIITGDIRAASIVLFEAQAAVSASLQFSADDKRRIEQKLADLKAHLGLSKPRQTRRSKFRQDLACRDDTPEKGRVNALRLERKRISMRSFSANDRVASLDSIVETFEMESGRA